MPLLVIISKTFFSLLFTIFVTLVSNCIFILFDFISFSKQSKTSFALSVTGKTLLPLSFFVFNPYFSKKLIISSFV